MNAARYMLECMEKEGVPYLFGIPGSGIAAFFDELYDIGPRIKTMLVKHEQSAAAMAYGYYRASHQVAACAATTGPGNLSR